MSTYRTRGSCSREIIFSVENDCIKNIKFLGGCSGNLQALAKLIVGMNIDEVIITFKGIQCKNCTSCPDQLASALIEYKKQQAEILANLQAKNA